MKVKEHLIADVNPVTGQTLLIVFVGVIAAALAFLLLHFYIWSAKSMRHLSSQAVWRRTWRVCIAARRTQALSIGGVCEARTESGSSQQSSKKRYKTKKQQEHDQELRKRTRAAREVAAKVAVEEANERFVIPSEEALNELTKECFQKYLEAMAEQEKHFLVHFLVHFLPGVIVGAIPACLS